MKKIIFLLAAFFLAGCTTTETQRIVLTEPMSEDLEKRVLKETGLSGALIGGIGGVALGFGTGFLAATIAGADPTTAVLTGAGTAVAGGVAGGVGGYYTGKRQGEKIVATAMDRDNLSQLLKGARDYNARLKSVNTQLQRELRVLQSSEAGKSKTRTSLQISRLAAQEINEANKRIAQREAAINNPAWDNSQKTQYRKELNTLVAERNTLQSIQIAAQKMAAAS